MNTEVKHEITRSERTQFVYDKVEKLKLTSSEFCDFDLGIDSLIDRAMTIADSEEYTQKMRPDPSYYIALLKCTKAERELYTTSYLRDKANGAFAYDYRAGKFFKKKLVPRDLDSLKQIIVIHNDMLNLNESILKTAEKDVLHTLGADYDGPGLEESIYKQCKRIILKCTKEERRLYTSISLRNNIKGNFAYDPRSGEFFPKGSIPKTIDALKELIIICKDVLEFDADILKIVEEDVLTQFGNDYEGDGIEESLYDQYKKIILQCTKAEREMYISDAYWIKGRDAYAYNPQTKEFFTKEILPSEKKKHKECISVKKEILKLDKDILNIVAEDILRDEENDYEGKGLKIIGRGREPKTNKRLDELKLCLKISKLTYEMVDIVLTKFFASNPLHLRNPIDALYAFVFRSRDAGAEKFNSLQKQESYIEKMLELLKRDQKDDSIADRGFLPTREIVSSFFRIAAGDSGAFESWIREMKSSFDSNDHRYGVRAHLQESLRYIARSVEAIEMGFNVPVNSLPDNEYIIEYIRRKYVTEDVDFNTISGEIFKNIKDIVLYNGLFDLGATEYKGMYHATNGIADDFYNLWHLLGIRFILEYKEQLPEKLVKLDGVDNWYGEYINELISKGYDEKTALTVSIDAEPQYLTALRVYLNDRTVSDTNEFKVFARRLESAACRFTDLMGDSAFLYIFSDWHYGCVVENRKSFLKRKIESYSYNNDKERLQRITRPKDRVVGENRTDITDVPRGLLILTELNRIDATTRRDGTSSDKFSEKRLVSRIDYTLKEYGYAPLDVRRKMDFMLYAAMRIVDRDGFMLSDMLNSLMDCIRIYTFDEECRNILKIADGEYVPREREHSHGR